ncbi:MAG: sulfatase-like hydrolase/transferase [Bacteroidales bacterium]|nr:sulfatase-like hydrolase/transferase [Bacteroidales bacterium]
MWSNREIPLWKVFIIRLGVMLLLLAISRWLLFVFNVSNFPDLSVGEQFRLFFIGMRFDIWTLIIANLPFLVFYGIPFRFKYNKVYCKVVDILFVITNSLSITLNLIDVIYYRYIDKRMTSELFGFMQHTDDNQGGLVKQFLVDFWFMVLVFILFLITIIILTRRTRVKPAVVTNLRYWYTTSSLAFLLLIALSIIGLRGGLQNKPISIITAAQYTKPQNMVLVLNTPFTIGRGSSGDVLKPIHYYDDDELEELYSPIQKDLKINRFIDGDAKDYNIFMIILESHGQEMVSFYNEKRTETITPFLDSLLANSLSFNGMANGRQSIEALTSILSGLPSLMSKDYVESRYAANRLDGFGSILKQHGYSTAFFHGGNNGTMNFNSSAFSAGFDNYYGRDEYGNDDDYDGTWGISDMPFLQFTALKLNEMPKPFAAGVFTLSSHHPFKLPKGYELPDGNYATDFEKTVRYTDDALRHFFETISKYDWFDSTIFVIVGDHVNPEHRYDNYLNGYGQYQIVTAIYAPCIIKPLRTNIMAQQTDIGVSLIAALGYNDSIFSFGRNVFDSLQEPCFSSYLNNIYQYSDGKHMLQSDGNNITAVFDLDEDPCLNENLYKVGEEEQWNELNNKFRMLLQQYNNRMINNKLYIK